MAAITRVGYGQVEPNHLSGIVTGQIYAQLPVEDGIDQLEQGQFAKYDYAHDQVSIKTEADGEYMLVYNEEKLYDERKQGHRHFVYRTKDFTDKKMYPRLIRTYVGDIITTNMIGNVNKSDDAEVTLDDKGKLKVGAYLTIGTDGVLTVSEQTSLSSISSGDSKSDIVWKVVKAYSMPDGQPGFKIQRVR